MSKNGNTSAFFSHLGRWTAELVLVFVGVYAAFWLNNYQQHQQDAEQRNRILSFIERILREGIEGAKTSGADQQRVAAQFKRTVDAGQMPPLQPFVFITDYSPGDTATLLQAGGVQLLDVETLTALRNDEAVIRWGLARVARYQKLSDELIMPNLDQDVSFFYDPATKKLRKRFAWYAEALEETANFQNELGRTHSELLKQIQAEQRQKK